MKILIINGPNLNMIRSRNSEFYGTKSFDEIKKKIEHEFSKFSFVFIHSDSESEIIKLIHDAPQNYRALIINPGAFSHSSLAIRDALEIIKIPKIEVHLSNISSRESFRKISITASVCDGSISGLKENSYIAAIHVINLLINDSQII